MYTPNELRDISFGKAVFGGYDMGDVDKTFKALSEDFATLFKENTMLKKKLKLLADTVEDYRSVDEAMRKALITAQNMANEMVAEAEKKSKEILANASDDAKKRVQELTAQIAEEESKLAAAKSATAEFIDKMSAMFDSQREKFAEIRESVAPVVEEKAAEESNSAEKMSDTIDEISKSLEEMVKLEEEELARRAKEAVSAEADEDTEAEDVEDADIKKMSDTIPAGVKIPTDEEMTALEEAAEKPIRRRRVEFENLKFGTDYDIKKD